MLIKHADDKSKRLAFLQELQNSTDLTKTQKDWLHDELWRLRQGIKGEKDAAYYINADYRDDPDCAVLHDLRIVEEGEVAQIDHLLIRRASMILLETKNFTGNVRINAQGEFSVLYPSGKRMGIASPLEQSRRHEKILRKLLDRLGIKARLGASIPMQHLVLFHPQTILQRPDSKAFDTSRVIKADQLRTWLDHFVNEQIDWLDTVKLAVVNLRSADTVLDKTVGIVSYNLNL